MMRPQRLGQIVIPDDELAQDKKTCRRFGPCGVGRKAIYLNSFYIDRRFYVSMDSVTRIFKRIAMSKGGFTGKGVFGSLPYLVVEYDDGKQKQCNFKHEEDVDRLLAYVETHFPRIPLHSVEAERKLAEKEKRLAEKYKGLILSEDAEATVKSLEKAKKYLEKEPELCLELSQSAKQKRIYEQSNPAYKWVALAITLLGAGALIYGIFALITHAGFGMYFLLFGLAAIFLFAGANVLPTAKNNRTAIEKRRENAVHTMEDYIQKSSDFPLPACYAHPVVIKWIQDIVRTGRAQTAEEALQLLKEDLQKLNASVTVEQEEYDEIIVIKPLFLVMNYE